MRRRPSAPPEDQDRLRVPQLSIPIMLAGLLGVFVFGISNNLFGKPISFTDIGTFGFFGSIWLGVFGVALAFTTVRGAFIAMTCTAMIFLVLFAAGKAARGEL